LLGLDLGSLWVLVSSGDTAVETIIVMSVPFVDQPVDFGLLGLDGRGSGFGLCLVDIVHGLCRSRKHNLEV
jgi:hypothetical protein